MALVANFCAKCLKNNSLRMVNMIPNAYYAAAATKVKPRSNVNEESNEVYKRPQKLYKTQDELVQYLMDNVLYNDDRILALNKPAGLPLQALQYHDEKVQLPPGYTAPVTQELSVFAVLQKLAREVKTAHLHCAFSLPREYSGVLVFTKTVEAAKAMKKHSLTNRIHKIHSYGYLGVLTGIPEPLEATSKINITRKNVNGWPVSILSSKSANEGKDISSCTLHYEVKDLNRSLNVALVNIHPNTSKWDSIPVFFLNKLTPLLGDHMYGSQLKTLMGKPYVHSKIEPEIQILPQSICDNLDIQRKDCSMLPLHLHLSSLTLPKISKGSSGQKTITAPIPEYFMRTLDKLGLQGGEK